MGLESSLKSYLLLFFLLSFLNVTTINSSNPSKEEAVLFGGKFRALYVFGDSLVDAGNNNHLPTTVKANFPPYGSNFEGGEATGRFTNGKTIADYTALYYGLPLVPAYLGLRKTERNIILTGFNYASAGCGILSVTGKAMGKCLSLKDQVKLFEKSIKKNLNTSIRTPSGLREHLAESLFMTSIGVNDYAFYKDGLTDGKDFADKLLHKYLIQLEKLHKLGARKFFINNIKPLGCYPNRVIKSVPRGSCDAHLNRVIRFFNKKLKRSLSIMKIKLNNTSFVYSDYFNFMLGVRGPQISQGQTSLVNITAPCCPKDFNGDSKTSCKRDSMVCEIPDSSHIFFDTRNPTQMANFLYSMECFEERRICHVV